MADDLRYISMKNRIIIAIIILEGNLEKGMTVLRYNSLLRKGQSLAELLAGALLDGQAEKSSGYVGLQSSIFYSGHISNLLLAAARRIPQCYHNLIESCQKMLGFTTPVRCSHKNHML